MPILEENLNEILISNKKIEEADGKHIDIRRCELMKCSPGSALDIVVFVDVFDDYVEITNVCLEDCYYETNFDMNLPNGDYDIVGHIEPICFDNSEFSTVGNVMKISVANGNLSITKIQEFYVKARKLFAPNEKIKISKSFERVFCILDGGEELNLVSSRSWWSPVIIEDDW